MQTEDAVVFHNLTIILEGDDVILSQEKFHPTSFHFLLPRGSTIPITEALTSEQLIEKCSGLPGAIRYSGPEPQMELVSIVISKAQLMTVIAALLKFTDEPESHPGKL